MKVLERFVACQVVSHLSEWTLLPELQSEYRAYHSTETALLRVNSDILEALDCGDLAALTLLDISGAFDTVDHTVLTRHLEMSYDIQSTVLDWFLTHLEQRVQYVQFRGCSATPLVLLCEVRQGSVLVTHTVSTVHRRSHSADRGTWSAPASLLRRHPGIRLLPSSGDPGPHGPHGRVYQRCRRLDGV